MTYKSNETFKKATPNPKANSNPNLNPNLKVVVINILEIEILFVYYPYKERNIFGWKSKTRVIVRVR
jgi:hypothetical protein